MDSQSCRFYDNRTARVKVLQNMTQNTNILWYDFCIELFKLVDLDHTLPCLPYIIYGKLGEYVHLVALKVVSRGVIDILNWIFTPRYVLVSRKVAKWKYMFMFLFKKSAYEGLCLINPRSSWPRPASIAGEPEYIVSRWHTCILHVLSSWWPTSHASWRPT